MTKPSWQDYGAYDESEHARHWDGVRAYYAPCLGPTGNRLYDHSRFGNWGDGSGLTLATAWTIDAGQPAIGYTGSNYHAVTEFRCTPNYTAAGWVMHTGGSYGVNLLGGLGRAADGTNDYLLYVSGATTVNMWGNQTPGSFSASTSITTVDSFTFNAWHHFVWRMTATAAEFYLNGKYQGVSAANPGVVRMGQIGARNGAAGWVGKVSDLVFWDRTLTPNEIRDLYLLGRGGMFERRRRSRRRAIEQAAGFRAYWVRQQSRVIGGGV